ncbi:MAG: hypothetical protein V1787_03475 [Candidatus Micrarchaeota archaeon]
MGTLRLAVKACSALNSRPVTIILIVAGFVISILAFPKLYSDGLSRKEAFAEVLFIFVPLLFGKLTSLTLLSFVDFTLGKSQESYRYRLNIEKARARVIRIMVEKKVRSYSLDSMALGSERLFLTAAAYILHAAGVKGEPPLVIVGENPFVLVRMRRQPVAADEEEGISAQLHYDDQKGQVLSKLISSTLGAP